VCCPVLLPKLPAASQIKNHSITSQNLENKGPEIFLPPRSMVLKVVRGKILETLELSWGSAAFVFTRIDRLPKDCQLSKIVSSQIMDYLVDNRYLCMLSQLEV
jgi:hypothetical protein